MIKTIPSSVKFGTIDIKDSHIFYYRKNVFAFVNLKPVHPGHILICPTRREKNIKTYQKQRLWNFGFLRKKFQTI